MCLYAACSCHEITEWKRRPGQGLPEQRSHSQGKKGGRAGGAKRGRSGGVVEHFKDTDTKNVQVSQNG
jgi:hypothetical protein